MPFTKVQVQKILDDVYETPGEKSIAEFENRENRAFDAGWRAALDAAEDLLNDPVRLQILGIKEE
jgi:hypothetical protein